MVYNNPRITRSHIAGYSSVSSLIYPDLFSLLNWRVQLGIYQSTNKIPPLGGALGVFFWKKISKKKLHFKKDTNTKSPKLPHLFVETKIKMLFSFGIRCIFFHLIVFLVQKRWWFLLLTGRFCLVFGTARASQDISGYHRGSPGCLLVLGRLVKAVDIFGTVRVLMFLKWA